MIEGVVIPILADWLQATVEIPETVVRIGAALGVVVIGWWVSRLVVRLLGRSVARRFRRPSIIRTVLRLIRLAVILVAFAIALWILDLTGVELLLSVTVFSAVIAIVLAPLVGNYINGMFVIADQPYEIGDLIEIVDEGLQGYVEDVTIRYTKIFTLDNTFLVIPNAAIRERDVLNYSAEDERTRISFDVVVTYDSDLEAVRSLLVSAAQSVDGVIVSGPPIRVGSARYRAEPVCHITTFGDDGIELLLRCWVRRPYRLRMVRSQVLEAIWDGFDDIDAEFAYPHRHHVFDDSSGVARVDLHDRID